MKNKTIETLELSVRSYNCLKHYLARKDIKPPYTIAKVISVINELDKVRNLGYRGMREIAEKLKPYLTPYEYNKCYEMALQRLNKLS